ncbi:MAG: HAMP domain-containing sensor histidine kinase [Candidatus Woykebacteria bacterium]
MDNLPKEGILGSFLIAGQLESPDKYRRFEHLSEIFTWLAVIIGLLIIQLPFGESLNRDTIYILAAAVGVFTTVWYHLLPKRFTGRLKRFLYNLITIAFITILVHNTNGVQSYATFFYILSIISVAMTLPLVQTAVIVFFAITLIFGEAFLTSGPLATNFSLALLHSWGLLLVVFFSRFNAGESLLLRKDEEETVLDKEKTVGKVKDEFVYIISHELKQPTTAIKGYIEQIREKLAGQKNSEAKEILDLTMINNDRLENLLDDLLDISQLDKGSLKINLADVSLKPIISEVISTLFIEAKNKRISLIQREAEEIAAKVDVDRLKEILTNLIGNAIKYTPEGGKVTVDSFKEGEFAKISVTDNGVGIPQEDQKHIFEKFYRVENEKTRRVKGNGLGLFVTKQLVEKMGGQIGFTSKMGEGTTFYFSLPRYRW